MNPILCSGETPYFLKFFDLSTAPPLLFYTYIPAITASLFLGFYVYKKAKGSLESKLLLFISIFFSLWVLDILVLWVASYNSLLMFGWQITPIFEVPLFIFTVYFTYVMTDKQRKDISPTLKLIFLSIMGIVFLILPTKLNIPFYNLNNCEGVPGIYWNFEYIAEMVVIVWVLGICISRFRALKKGDEFKKQIIYFGIGVASFLVLFAGSNIVGQMTDIQVISFLGSLGVVILLAFLSYLIVRYNEFKIKVFATQALVFAITLLIGSQIFTPSSTTDLFVTAITLIAFLASGFFLIKSVKGEIEQRERVEQLAEQLSEFMSLATHEIRGPATFIKGFTASALEGDIGELTSATKDGMQKIFVRADDIIHLSNQYLDKSKLELNQLKYEFAPTDLGEMVGDLVREFQPAAAQRGIMVMSAIDKNQSYGVQADSGKIKEVIGNLIDNAVKYTPKGSVTISIAKDEKTVTVKIADTGVGISAETIPQLFKKFSRADAEKVNLLGSGLGLYLAKIFIDAHHGRIWVESEGKDKGSTFFVELPTGS
ncbi:MAG: HAMP domain-containing sensor histidine kinase [Minisyncoccia bacterium]|jgi:signal transduction histidine kinase